MFSWRIKKKYVFGYSFYLELWYLPREGFACKVKPCFQRRIEKKKNLNVICWYLNSIDALFSLRFISIQVHFDRKEGRFEILFIAPNKASFHLKMLIFYLFLLKKYILGVLIRSSSPSKYPEHMFSWRNKKDNNVDILLIRSFDFYFKSTFSGPTHMSR